MRYRFLTGFIFAVAATVVMPIFGVVFSIFITGKGFPSKEIPGLVGFGSLFAPFAFFWGTAYASRFRSVDSDHPPPGWLRSFLWGSTITFLTMFSFGQILSIYGLFFAQNTTLKDALFSGLGMAAAGSIVSLGIVYVVGGAAGMITNLLFRRIPHAHTLKIIDSSSP